MKERPILFSGPMVRALLDGRKTQTRRAIKLPPAPMHLGEWEPSTVGGIGCTTKPGGGDPVPEQVCIWHTRTGAGVCCPYGVPGDRLWVREEFSGWHHHESQPPREWSEGGSIWYWADGDPTEGDWTRPRPSIHMPRWASRLTLEITEVRIERLQDISLRDVVAEGCEVRQFWLFGADAEGRRQIGAGVYRALWEQINGTGSWDANPWVWAVSFAVVR